MTRANNLVWACAASMLVALVFFLTNATSDAMTPSHPFFASGPQAALEAAIRANDAAAMQRAIGDGASVNARGRFDITPLMVAVDVQNVDAVRRLLASGALPNARARDGSSPVSLAVKSCRAKPHGWQIMLAVFEAGGDVDTRQPDGDPVIMQFVLDHDPSGLKLMKSLGANLDILDRGGDPLITNVAMAQDWDMAWALIELGAQVDYEHGKSRQPLSLALKGGHPAPDSPQYLYKRKVWQYLEDKGLPVPPLDP